MRNKRTLILVCIAAALFVAAGVEFTLIWHQGDIARQNASKLLSQYNSAVSARTALSVPPSPSPGGSFSPASPGPSCSPTASAEALPSGDYTQPGKPDVEPSQALISLPGYDVIGKLVIQKIGVELPVISKTTASALRVSICWYCGALPGQKGNMVITGHDYANGAHFGKLNSLTSGDTVEFDAPDGTKYEYTVYQTLVINPDDTKSLQKYEGDYGLTLVTCTSNGNRRLLVRCKLNTEMGN